jgi:site-specific DNA recombinase
MVKINSITWSYVRCSTTRQDLSIQQQQLTDYSKAFGFSITQHIKDFGVSGSTFDREGLNKIKEGIINKSFDQLIIYSISRLGRSMVETISLLNDLSDNGINVISLKENLDLSTPSGKMISQIFSVLSEYELATLKSRICDSLRSRRNHAKKYCKSIYGFDIENGDIVLNVKEQKVIRKIIKMYKNGSGYTEISNYLNKNNHRIKNGNEFSRAYVNGIIKNKQEISDRNSPFYNDRTPNYL